MMPTLESRSGTKRERTRDQLLISAQALLMEADAAALGLRQITAHAGLVHASFYNYYPDVAALIGLRESALRTLHREVHGKPAGAHLRELRLSRAEALLATTGLTLTEIARQVGYGHAETLQHPEYARWLDDFFKP